MGKQLYDYWFVQFEYPDENGKPYKSSGGKMSWNETLKRHIPEAWNSIRIGDILDKVPSTKKYDTSEYLQSGKYPIVDQGEKIIVGYTNDSSNLLTRIPAIVFGDHSTRVKLVNYAFARGADGTQILYSKDNLVSQYYLYYSIASISIPNPGYSRHFKYLKDIFITQPTKDIANEFETRCKHYVGLQSSLLFQSIELEKQRENLLSLLITGQISSM